jgi:hypothetical protein
MRLHWHYRNTSRQVFTMAAEPWNLQCHRPERCMYAYRLLLILHGRIERRINID